jgi:hypothetical protein
MVKGSLVTQFRQFMFSGFLDDNEQIKFIAHRHLFTHLRVLVRVAFLGVCLPLFFQFFFPEAVFFWSLWAAGGLLVLIYNFLDWYFDTWIFTNFGVVVIAWNGFFDRSASRIDYHMIDGFSYTITGFVRTVFNYGDITIERLGAMNPVTLNDACAPRAVERKFGSLHAKYLEKRRYHSHENLKDLLAEMLHSHVRESVLPDQE